MNLELELMILTDSAVITIEIIVSCLIIKHSFILKFTVLIC